jgi:hypothetical protein
MDALSIAWIVTCVVVIVLALGLAGMHTHNARLNADVRGLQQSLDLLTLRLEHHLEAGNEPVQSDAS